MSSAGGICLAMRSTSAYGMSMTRPTSRMTAFAFMVPNVMICETFSRPYFVGDVLDHFAAAALAEVDVDIGQRHALGVEEALENQIVVERIDVGDAQRPGGEAAGGRAAARSDGNALLARVADEVPDDQEVAGIAHLLDHRDLVGEPLVVRGERVPQLAFRIELAQPLEALRVALPHDVLEVIVEREALGHGELRQVVFARRDRDVAALGDEQRVLHRLRVVAEDLRHLRGGLQEELIAVILQPVRRR